MGSSEDTLTSVCSTLVSYSENWWIAGGWALDIHLGGRHRSHQDVDVAVLRRDQNTLRRFLSGWSIHKVVDGARVPWPEAEQLALPVHEIHADCNGARLEFLLNEAVQDRWLFRRNRDISLPLSALGRTSSAGIPYLCPQVVLLYKAKNPRPLDQDDFERMLPTLQSSERLWLAQALEVCHPSHEWLYMLT